MAASKEFCDPCSRDDKNTAGIKVCIDCGESLCESCLKAHGLFKALASHYLVDVGALPSSVLLKPNALCEIHPEKTLDLYCTEHELLCCRSCMVEKHRTCQSMLPIEDASKNVNESSLLSETPKSLLGIIKTLDRIDEKRKSNSAEFQKEVKNIKDEVAKLKSRALKKIDDAEKKIFKELGEKEAKQMQEMDHGAKETQNIRETTQQYINELEVATKFGSKNQKFLLLQTLRSKIQSLVQVLQQQVTSLKLTTISFSQSSNFMSSLESIGCVEMRIDPCSLVHNIEQHKQAQVMHTPNETLPRFQFDRDIKFAEAKITSVAITQDNILMCNYNERGVLVYNKNYKKQTTCRLSGNPWDIALIPGSDLAVVTIPDRCSIQFIHLNIIQAGRMLSSPNEKEVSGIAATTDKLFLGEYGIICITNLNCNLIKTVTSIGTRLIQFMDINTNNQHLYCSIPSDKSIICTNFDGKKIFECKDQAFHFVEGVTTDVQGNIYVGDYGSHCIHMLSSDGKYKGEVLQDYTLKYVWDICYDNLSRKMYISHEMGRTLSIFNLL